MSAESCYLKRVKLFLYILVIIFALISSRQVSASIKKDFIEDLQFIYKVIQGDHPGVFNKLDSEFNSHLHQSYNYALSELAKTNDSIELEEILLKFVSSFNDSHLSLQFKKKTPYRKDKKFNSSLPENVNEELFNLDEIKSSTYLIKLPTFFINSPYRQECFNKLLLKIPSLKNSSIIIFDLRYNQGGNSFYGSEIVNALFGFQYFTHKVRYYNKNTYVDWRASPGNLKHIVDNFTIGANSTWGKKVASGIKQALFKNLNYYREFPQECKTQNKITKEPRREVTAKIFVIIDSVNVSAALGFIDYLKMMDYPITLVGKKTKSDRLYMEVRHC